MCICVLLICAWVFQSVGVLFLFSNQTHLSSGWTICSEAVQKLFKSGSKAATSLLLLVVLYMVGSTKCHVIVGDSHRLFVDGHLRLTHLLLTCVPREHTCFVETDPCFYSSGVCWARMARSLDTSWNRLWMVNVICCWWTCKATPDLPVLGIIKSSSSLSKEAHSIKLS